MLAVIESHPVQYHAPVYRALQAMFGIPVTAIYGSDAGVAGYRDREFGVSVAWDTDLLRGYDAQFLQRTAQGTLAAADDVRARGVGACLAQLKPQAVMLLGYGSRFDRHACYEAWRTGVPLLFRGETTDHALARARTRAWLRDNTLRLLYRRFARVLYIGQHSLRHHQRLGVPTGRLVFAPYCIDAEQFACGEDTRRELRGAARSELGVGESDIVLLCSGKISERKGPDVLLQAARELPASLRARLVLCFVGDGNMRAAMQSASADTPAVRARFPGFQNQTQLSRFYHSADALVMPSLWGETWGLVVNEALHHGVPCIVSEAVGCAPDLIESGKTGHTFMAGSATSLAAAVIRSLNLLNRSEIRELCRQQVSGYSVAEAARGIATAYGQVT